MDIESLALSDFKSLSSAKILIVDDNKHNQELFTKFLAIMDISDISCADDGVSGIEMMIKNEFDLVILDVNMPNMNGEEFLYNIRQVPEFKEIPVIVQTGDESTESKEKMFKAGATDYVVKPVSPLEFFSRVRVHLENIMLVKQLSNEVEKMKNNMDAIRKMQISLYPDKAKVTAFNNIYNVNIENDIKICSRIGGSFWDLIKLDDNNLLLLVGEASGYGIAASMNVFRFKTLIEDITTIREEGIDKYIDVLNEKLEPLLQRGQYVAVACIWIDLEQNKIHYSNAGFQSPILKLKNGDLLSLTHKAAPLGMVKSTVYAFESVDFNIGDTLYLYGSSILNGKNNEGIAIGIDGIKSAISRAISLNDFSSQIKSSIVNNDEDFAAVSVVRL